MTIRLWMNPQEEECLHSRGSTIFGHREHLNTLRVTLRAAAAIPAGVSSKLLPGLAKTLPWLQPSLPRDRLLDEIPRRRAKQDFEKHLAEQQADVRAPKGGYCLQQMGEAQPALTMADEGKSTAIESQKRSDMVQRLLPSTCQVLFAPLPNATSSSVALALGGTRKMPAQNVSVRVGHRDSRLQRTGSRTEDLLGKVEQLRQGGAAPRFPPSPSEAQLQDSTRDSIARFGSVTFV